MERQVARAVTFFERGKQQRQGGGTAELRNARSARSNLGRAKTVRKDYGNEQEGPIDERSSRILAEQNHRQG